MTESFAPVAVRVRGGVVDATLGDMSGASGMARRSFEVSGVEYVDIELSAETLEQLPVEQRNRFYDQKIVFTRLRLPRTSVEPAHPPQSNAADPILFSRRREEMQRVLSREWYYRIGNLEQDPTVEAVDLAQRVSRRRALLVAAGVGAIALGTVAYALHSCDADTSRSGSWGRSGGWYGGHGGGFGG